MRALLWAVAVHVLLGGGTLALASLYDRVTGAPPAQTGAPHNFPGNPFVLLFILIASPFFAPFVYLMIAATLYVLFSRRAAAGN